MHRDVHSSIVYCGQEMETTELCFNRWLNKEDMAHFYKEDKWDWSNKKEDEEVIPRDQKLQMPQPVSWPAAALLKALREEGLDLLKTCHSTRGCCLCPSCSSGITPFPQQRECPPATVTNREPEPFSVFSFLSALWHLTGSHLARELRKCSSMSPRPRCS